MSEHKLEDAITQNLTGEVRENALHFAAFLRANDILLESKEDGKGWALGGIVGNSQGFMMIDDVGKNLGVWINDCDFANADPADDDIKEFAWAHVVICPQEPCVKSGGCAEKNHYNMIFGKEYKSTCHSPLAFFNPDAETVKNIEKLIMSLKK